MENRRKPEGNKLNKRDYTSTFWKELGDSFTVICAPDNRALSILINKARGNRSLDRFAHECNFSANTLYRTLRLERIRPIAYKDILSMAAHAAEGSGVTLEQLMAANGMSANPRLEEARREIETTVKQVRGLNETGTSGQNVTRPGSLTERERFLSDLAFYTGIHNPRKIEAVNAKKEGMFNDHAMRCILSEYRRLSELEDAQKAARLREYMETGKWQDSPEKKSCHYKFVLDQMIMGKEGVRYE